MSNQRYKGLFEDWEVGVATKVIARFRKQWTCLEREAFEDLLQECLIKWHSVKMEYDPSTGQINGRFMYKVIEHKLLHKVEELTADKRNVSNKSVSLNQPLTDEEDSSTFLDKLAEDEDYTTDPRATVGRRIDISKALQKLSLMQQKLCHLLGEERLSIKKASEVLGIPRTTLYDEKKRIKAFFEKEGLRDYLK